MADPDPDRPGDVRYDRWPIERESAFDEHEEAVESDEEVREDIEWLGMMQGTGKAWVYDPGSKSVYGGELDEENERVMLQEEERQEIESEESLGEHIERIGEEHEWDWLSSFAREYLEDDDAASGEDASEGLALRDAEFEERNVAANADHDVAFTARNTFEDPSGRVHIQEQWFYARAEGARYVVDVDEEFLDAEEPREEESAGDAEEVAGRELEFDVDVDTDRSDRKAQLREALREWAEEHRGWPEADR